MHLYEGRPIGTVPRARKLRRDAPTPERRLLRALREAFPQLKWRHRTPLGPHYTDILCLPEQLVIEVDGDTHANDRAHDATRAAFMARRGFDTLRIANADVMHNLDGVLATISLREREGAARWRKGEGNRATKKGGAA